ncbi:MAG: glycosyltransferase [Oscillospiraceae bacterium]|nr:glycosyltransferase [Oscillospiraceae bacterium]
MTMLSFTIPCYGSEKTIKSVIDEIHSKMSEKKEYDYEIITVNDCSPDNVISVLKETAAADKRLRVIDLSRNAGKHAALMAAYSVVRGDIIINLDDDGQCPLDKLWELIAPLDKGFDISIARYSDKKQSSFKNFGSYINSLMAVHLISKPKNLYLSNFSAVKRYVIEEMCNYRNPYPYIDGLFIRTTSKITNVDMEERERTEGTGNFTFKKSLSLWMNGFTAFSVKPLRIADFAGILCALIGFIFAVYTIIRKLVDPDIAVGYSSIMAVILIIGGIIMVLLGLIGEYIGRIYMCINDSPQYVIREKINFDPKELK